MKELESDGLFWLADKPDEKVAGHLKTDGRQGAELVLIGAFHNPVLDFGGSVDRVRILGVAGNRYVTLDNCFRVAVSHKMPGVDQETYLVPTVFEGVHFDTNEELSFHAFELRLSNLEHWVGIRGIALEQNVSQSGKDSVTLSYSQPESLVTPTIFGNLTLNFLYSLSCEYFEGEIAQCNQFKFDFYEPQPLARILQLSAALQDLLTIGANGLSTIECLSLFHPDEGTKSGSGRVPYIPIALHKAYRGKALVQDKKAIHSVQMLFAFEDIRGLDGIAQWLEVTEKFKPVVATLTAQWYRPRMYTDNRFFNAVTAAEALQRICLQRKRVDLLKALKSLAEKAGDAFHVLVGDIDRWAKVVRATRVNNVVHRGLCEDDNPELYFLSESLYFLVVLCLLQECGVPKDALAKVQRHQRFSFAKEQIQARL